MVGPNPKPTLIVVASLLWDLNLTLTLIVVASLLWDLTLTLTLIVVASLWWDCVQRCSPILERLPIRPSETGCRFGLLHAGRGTCRT